MTYEQLKKELFEEYRRKLDPFVHEAFNAYRREHPEVGNGRAARNVATQLSEKCGISREFLAWWFGRSAEPIHRKRKPYCRYCGNPFPQGKRPEFCSLCKSRLIRANKK